MELIRVTDNGTGISQEYYEGIGLRHYTSKIDDLSSLENLETYGFRGEAMSSLCSLAGEVRVITRTKDDAKATRLTFNRNGGIIK